MNKNDINKKIILTTFTLVLIVCIFFIYIFKKLDNKDSVTNDIKNNIVLSIENDQIYSWFKTKSGLCDEYSLSSIPERKLFCKDINYFKSKTNFKNLIQSNNGNSTGFTIQSEILTPDTVVGIWNKNTNQVSLLTNYYLGNEFISFSPDGTKFVYKGSCWEGLCALFVVNVNTLEKIADINNPEYADYKSENANFIEWISNNQIKYSLSSLMGNDLIIEEKSF